MIAVGVQTWGTDVAALRRYWAAADALGYARVTYGDGLWDFTHDGWTLLAALALQTRRCRIGPAVTYAFDPAAHHVSWLAKRAVAIDHLADGRLDVRLAVGAEAPGVAEAWRRHGIVYPPASERLLRLETTIDALRRLWAGDSVTSSLLGLDDATLAPPPVQRRGPPVWVAAMGPRAIELAARCADGWEASFLAPPAFADCAARVETALTAAGRPRDALRRSVEVDAALADTPGARGRRYRWVLRPPPHRARSSTAAGRARRRRRDGHRAGARVWKGRRDGSHDRLRRLSGHDHARAVRRACPARAQGGGRVRFASARTRSGTAKGGS